MFLAFCFYTSYSYAFYLVYEEKSIVSGEKTKELIYFALAITLNFTRTLLVVKTCKSLENEVNKNEIFFLTILLCMKFNYIFG